MAKGNLGRVAIAIHGSVKDGSVRARKLKRVRADGTVDEITHEDLLTGLVQKTAVEIARVEGERPEGFLCPDCLESWVTIAPKGRVPVRCKRCLTRARSARFWQKNIDKLRVKARVRAPQKQAAERAAYAADPKPKRAAYNEYRRRNLEKVRAAERLRNERRKAERVAARKTLANHQ